MLVTILAIIVLLFMALSMFLSVKYYQLNKAYIEAQNLLRDILLNNDLIDQSLATICESYSIERGDLLRLISGLQVERRGGR